MDDKGRRRHRRPRDQNPWASLVFGMAVLACGVILWLDHLGRIDARDYVSWWPVAVVALGLAHLAHRQWASGVIFVAVGAAFLGPLFGYPLIHFWRLLALFPLMISVGGVALVLQALRPAPRGNALHMVAVMAGNVRQLGSHEFAGGDAVAVMGGCEIDLGAARLTGEAVIDVLAFWGGIEIRVPRGWRVVSRTSTILASFTDLTDGGTEGAPQLIVRGTAIMGGVGVRNSELPA